MRFVPSEINQSGSGRLLVVGRDPGGHEVEEGRPFVGLAGMLLDEVLSECGLRRQDANIANVVGYQPPENDFLKHDERVVQEGVEQLHMLVRQLRPSLIITLGNEASYALIPEWPTKGRGIFGAKNIMDRRGYVWDTPSGRVLSTLHPAGVLRKQVPGRYLLGQDFRRARKLLHGLLPRDTFPPVKRLNNAAAMYSLLHSRLIGWDVETKWDNTSLLCSGYCGDDEQPYVAAYPREFNAFGAHILRAPVPKVGHNVIYDLVGAKLLDNIDVVNCKDDTQTMWWALEPELAGSEDTSGEDYEVTAQGSRMTRKGLAFLCSLYFNLPWWKNYPDKDDPDHLEKMIVINSNDAWVTRVLAESLLYEIKQEGVIEQYRAAMNLYPALMAMHMRGLHVDETLRQEREKLLRARSETARERSSLVAVEYIKQHDVQAFRKLKRCPCCGGGKVAAQHCWKCANILNETELFAEKPSKKVDYLPAYSFKWECEGVPNEEIAKGFKKEKISALRTLLPACVQCEGTGKIKEYHYNPYSEKQMKTLLYTVIGAPKHTWKGKTVTDDSALRKILRWARNV